MLADAPDAGSALHFVPDHGTPGSTRVMRLAAPPSQIFLSTAAADALVAERDAPHPVWRIAAGGEVVVGMQPDRFAREGRIAHEVPPNWMGLSALHIDPGVLHVVADVTSDARRLVTYDGDGEQLSSRVVHAPFGFVAAAWDVPVLAALRTFEESELALYTWRWRDAAGSYC